MRIIRTAQVAPVPTAPTPMPGGMSPALTPLPGQAPGIKSPSIDTMTRISQMLNTLNFASLDTDEEKLTAKQFADQLKLTAAKLEQVANQDLGPSNQ